MRVCERGAREKHAIHLFTNRRYYSIFLNLFCSKMENQEKVTKKRIKQKIIEENPYKYFHFLRSEIDRNDPDIFKHIYECEICKNSFNGTKKSNLKAHLEKIHKKQYDEISSENTNDSIAIQRLHLLHSLVEIVSVNGRPFKSLQDSGFQKVIKEKLDYLRENGHGINLSDKNLTEIKSHLSATAKKIQEKISSEINGEMVSLMVDIVTRNHRSILGVSIQYVFNDTLRIRSIGMIELKQSHTAIYLSQVITDCLKKYGIGLQQVIVITTDNGANVQKMVRDIEGCLQRDINAEKHSCNMEINRTNEVHENIEEEIAQVLAESEDISEDGTLFSIQEEVVLKENETLLSSILHGMQDEGVEFLYDITGVNCAEHTLQLAIKDALKRAGHTVQNLIELCRRACKIFRLSSTSVEIKEAGIKYVRPRLENETRWGSLYLMVRLIKLN